MKEISNMGFTPELCFEHLRYHFAQEVKKREKSFVAEPSQMESMKKVASWLTTGKEHCWLVLNGITGNGKTTCVKGMRSFINSCKIPDPSNGEGSVFSSKAGIWLVTARELYQMFVSNKPKFERCANTYILAIDELGTEETDFCEYGNRYKPIEQLLSYRYDKMLPTIISVRLMNSTPPCTFLIPIPCHTLFRLLQSMEYTSSGIEEGFMPNSCSFS